MTLDLASTTSASAARIRAHEALISSIWEEPCTYSPSDTDPMIVSPRADLCQAAWAASSTEVFCDIIADLRAASASTS